MMQRLVLAKTLLHRPSLFLLDEPASGLDPMASNELSEILKKLSSKGATILMASHNYNLIKGRGRPIYEIKDGILRVR